MKHTLRILIVAIAFAFTAAPAFAQKAAPVDTAKLPTLTLHKAGAKGADKAIGKTSDGDITYRGSRGGVYYYKGDTKHYLNAKQKEELGL